MKKIKLLAPMLGTLTALTAVVPAVSCNYKKKEEKKYDVKISKGFSLSETEATEGQDFECDITWKQEGYVIDESKIHINVGNQKLTKNSFSYTKGKADSLKGHLFIDGSAVADEININVELINIKYAPLSIINIGNQTQDVVITKSDDYATIGDDLNLTLSWPEDKKCYSNLVTIYVGEQIVKEKSDENPTGFTWTPKTETSCLIVVPKENITTNVEIKVLIDLEKSEYDKLIELGWYGSQSISLEGGLYDALWSSNNKGEKAGFAIPDVGYVIEFAIDLSKWQGRELDDTLFFGIGDYREGGNNFTLYDLKQGVFGNVWYGSDPVYVERTTIYESYPTMAFTATNGWGDQKGIITGWYLFSEKHISYPAHFFIGQKHTA